MVNEAGKSGAAVRSAIHVTFVAYTMGTTGGVERVTTLIANELAQRGYRVSIVTLWGEKSQFPLHADVRLYSLHAGRGSLKGRYLSDILGIRTYLRTHTPDVVVGAETSVMLMVLPAAAGLPVTRVGWEHFNFGTTFGRFRGRLSRWHLTRLLLARFGRAVVVLTHRDAELWRAGVPSLRTELRVIANPLSFARSAANPYRPGRRVVLAAGRLSEQKGFDLLLKAWERVEPDFPDWTLRIVGGGWEEKRLKAQALHAGLTRVEFTGAVSDMRAQYAEAGVYCLSSRHEGLPMVLIESLACGLPLVAFDCETGPRELIEHGENGLLVPPGDTAALAGALRQVMADPARRARMSEHSYQAAARFEPDRIVAAWEDLLESLARRSSPARPHLGALREQA